MSPYGSIWFPINNNTQIITSYSHLSELYLVQIEPRYLGKPTSNGCYVGKLTTKQKAVCKHVIPVQIKQSNLCSILISFKILGLVSEQIFGRKKEKKT